jgi:hypothetical protein
MSHLYGELPMAERQECEAHLGICPECRASVEGWGATRSALDTDQATLVLPPRKSRATSPWQATLRWALAASVVLGAGFLTGRLSGPSQADVRREVALARQQLSAELQTRYQEDMKTLAAAAVDSSTAENRRFLETLTGRLSTVQNDERREFLKAMQAYEDRHVMDYAELRGALNQLAQRTGNGFRQTESQLNQLAGALPLDETPSSLPNAKKYIQPAHNQWNP